MKFLLPILILCFLSACTEESEESATGLRYIYKSLDGQVLSKISDQEFYADITIKNNVLDVKRMSYTGDKERGIARGEILESKRHQDHFYYLIKNAFGDSKIGVRLYLSKRSSAKLDSIICEYRESNDSVTDEDLIITGDIHWKGKYRKL
ncbi:hypothetical protein N9355_10280 [Crocinitomicaceae bacterium]|nr:hypothetical protein [Crocinitomicaceae bacterium]